MRRALAQMTPEDARIVKRKFRKLWRKAMKAEIGDKPRSKKAREESAKTKYGVGKHVPSRAERNARKKLVFDLLWTQVIAPMITRFENPDNQKVST